MSDMYQIRCWTAGEKKTWEFWVRADNGGWFRSPRWEKVSSHNTEEAAMKAMRGYVAPHYESTRYFDERGYEDLMF